MIFLDDHADGWHAHMHPKTHILGMAKSPLNLKGAKSRSVELDYLRLLHTVIAIRHCPKIPEYQALIPHFHSHDAHGYLFVIAEDIRRALISNLASKYDPEQTTVRLLSLEAAYPHVYAEHIQRLRDEKSRNASAIVPGAHPGRAAANLGRLLGEKYLELWIRENYADFNDPIEHPFGVQWDFYQWIPGKIAWPAAPS
ncbi:MAG: hypothetical protein K1X75_13125 [Leptospirales bacterium]|nr:hypothetical protein [Leptospirales bacterium]